MLELRNFDLNLLVAFDLLMQEQNVSRAAERMFVSQSAIHPAETTAATEQSVAGQDALRHEANGQGGIGTYWLRVLPFLAREEQRAEQGFDVSQCQ